MAFFLIYVVLILAALLALGAWIWKRHIRREGEVSRSLGTVLFSVVLPKLSPKDAESLAPIERAREKIAVMEQLYRNLRDIHDSFWHEFLYGPPTFSLELAVPEVGEEVMFFVGVPRRFGLAVEKVIQGLYADAEIRRVKDYNIFNPFGRSFAFSLSGARSSYLPLKTYQSLEADPLKLFIEAFSKIQAEGEGAAIQIIAAPADKSWGKRLSKIAALMRKGKSLGAAIAEASRGMIEKEFSALVKSAQTKDKNKPEKPPEIQNEELVKSIEQKAAKPLFDVSVRMIASAGTKERAEEIARALAAPFQIFTIEASNGLKSSDVHDSAFKDLIYRFSFRLLSDKSRLVLSSEELASLFHFPNAPLESPKVKVLKSREAPAPVEMPRQGLLLGKNSYRGEEREVRIMDDDRRRHLYIIGQTGTGKSVFLKEMIRQDILAGKGVCFIDPHGDAAEEILSFIPPERADDLIYFNPGDTERPMGLNMLEYDPRYPEQKTFIINELLDIFNKLYDMKLAGGPMFEQYFRNATALVMDDPSSGNTLLEINRVLLDKQFRDLKLSKTSNPLVRQFWTQLAEKAGGEADLKNLVPYISSKFDTFLSNEIMRPIIAQQKSAFNFRDVMDSGKILLINLSKGRLGELNSSLIGLIMVGKLLMAAFSRVDIQNQDDRKDFYLYIDEFQNVTTKSIATILSEARKYRLDLTITHQFIGQLEEDIKKAVFGNVGSMVSFRIGVEDTEILEKQFAPVITADDLLNLPNRHGYARLLINGQVTRAFSFETPPMSQGNPAVVPQLKEFSRLKYGADRAEVEKSIVDRYNAQTSPSAAQTF